MSLLDRWALFFTDRDSLSDQDVEALEKSGLPLTFELLEATAYADPSVLPIIEKAIEVTKKPKGPLSNRSSVDKDSMNPGSIPGLKAPGQKTRASADAQTVPAPESAVEQATDVLYVAKRDHPKRPVNCIGETPHSWKVPVGAAQPSAQEDADTQARRAAGEEEPEAPTPVDVGAYSKKYKAREVVTGHLSGGRIVDMRPLGVDGATDATKIIIDGNGAGVMKPDTEYLYEQQLKTSKEAPVNKLGWSFNEQSNEWQRVEAKQHDLYDPKAIGSFGSGCIPYKRNVQREVSAYHVSNLLGIGAVPVTVKRTHDGKPHSVQDFKPNCKDVVSLLSTTDRDPETYGERLDIRDSLHKIVGEDEWSKTEQRLKDMAVFDIVINNQDRHAGNLIIDPTSGDVHLIDHGFAFGNSMHGSRNYLLQHVFHGNEVVRMSDTLSTRLKNTSVRDFERAMPDMYDWEAGQAWLRSRYVLWLQENHGSLDREKFLHTQISNDATRSAPGDGSAWSFIGPSRTKQIFEHLERKAAGHLPHNLFESWAKAFLDDVSTQESHPDHKDALHVKQLGVFMAPGFPSVPGGAEAYRRAGKHKEYEASIKGTYDIPKKIPRYSDRVDSEEAQDSVPTPTESATVNVSFKRKPR